MIQSTKEFRKEINSIFGTLKILVLLFCVVPVIQQIFMTSEGEEIIFYNISKMLAFCLIIVVVGVFWLVMNYAFKSNHVRRTIEIFVISGVGAMCYIYTGLHESNYKFIFALIILIYSMELGLRFGMIFSIVAGSVIIICDLLFCDASMRPTYFQSDFMLASSFCFAAYIVGFYMEKDRSLITTLNDSVNRDSLTGLFNHRYFQEHIHEAIKNPSVEKKEYLLMMDIDYFKVYNDTLGHQKGDTVLKILAEICTQIVTDGVVFRYGGEEFAIHFLADNLDDATQIAERLRLAVADQKFEGQELMPGHNLTVSIGMAERKSADDTASDWIERADNALYKAKTFRKNRVQVYSSVYDRFDNLDRINDDERIISIRTLLSVINTRDRYTYNHTDRVVHYCEIYSKYAKLSEDDSRRLLYGAYLHDIGKINIAQEILISEKRLTEEQWECIKKHPTDGAEIVRKIKNFGRVANIVEQHHEKYNGSGYPRGLKGEEISYLARVLTLADSFDAMTANRPYQKAKTFEEAFAEIRRCKGVQFDPEISETFIAAIRDMYF